MSETPQQTLARLARDRGVSLSALSRMLGRNVAYLQQYVGRGSPRILPERERRVLADFLAVDEAALGAPPVVAGGDTGMVAVPYLTVAAAAGAGRTVDEERLIRTLALPVAMLREHHVRADLASLIDVAGDSMAPTLLAGDRVLVDRGDRVVPRAGGVFVMRWDGGANDAGLAIKRIRHADAGWRIASDNPAYLDVLRPRDAVTIIGRARLLLRDL